MSEVVAFYYRQLWAVKRYYVLWSISWLDDLTSYQYHIYELPEEHESKSEQLETSYSIVAQVKAINTKHSQEDGKDQSHIEVLAIPKNYLKVELSWPLCNS